MPEFPSLEVPADQGMGAGGRPEPASSGYGSRTCLQQLWEDEAKLHIAEKRFGQVSPLSQTENAHFEGFGIGWDGSAAHVHPTVP